MTGLLPIGDCRWAVTASFDRCRAEVGVSAALGYVATAAQTRGGAPVKIALAVPGMAAAVLLLAFAAVAFIFYAGTSGADSSAATGQVGVVCASDTAAGSVAGFKGDQLSNAAVIVAVGKALHVPERGLVIAVATSMQEATLHNLTYGDTMSNGQMSSSRGLFQQLKTYGPNRTVPARAAEMFYNGGPGGIPGLLQVPGWQSMPLARAAEAVQGSAQPELYAKWEQPANEVVGKVEGRACTVSSSGTGTAALPSGSGATSGGSPAARGAIARALSQVGVPYSWGGGSNTGPTLGMCGSDGAANDCHIVGFDCSGLAMYAYAGVGIQLPHQTQLIWAAFPTHITDRAQLLPGDLLLISSNGEPSGIHHVVIFLGGDQVVEAPYSGVQVRVTDNFWASSNGRHFIGAVRPGGVV